MTPKLLPLLVAGAFVPVAFGQDQPSAWSGSVTLGIRNVAENANDPSKLNEYRDLESGAVPVLGFELRRDADLDYFRAFGENIGRDDQYLNLTGGRYGSFKYRLYSDDLRHNFGSGPGARSPYNGIGGTTLTGTLPNLNVSSWNTFDHSYKRRDLGGFYELQATRAWYARVDANEVTRSGINVFAGAKGTSPGNGFMDLPAPIDYTARNITGEVGHTTKRSHLAFTVHHSLFDNGNQELRWQNDFFGNGLDRTMLPPSNRLTRFAVNGNLRQLPVSSTLAGRVSYSRLTDDVAMPATQLSTGGAFPATNPSDSTFRGDIATTTASLALNSRPSAAADTKVYWNYIRQRNDSTEMSFNPAVGSGLRIGSTNPAVNCGNVAGAPCEAERFHYTKDNLGGELGYRLSSANRLLFGLDYTKTDRERADFPTTKDVKLYGQLRTTSLDWATARIKYQYLDRRSDFQPDQATLLANPMDLYVRRFDYANVNQNLLKLAMDTAPLGGFDFGLELIFKDNNYKDTPLGRTSDQRQEDYFSAGYGDPGSFRVFAFTDVEYTRYKSNHRVGNQNPDPAAGAIPAGAGGNATYNWSATNKDKAWQIGVGTDWVPRARFRVKASAIYAETNGTANFSAEPPPGVVVSTLPINNFDNTKRISLNLRGVYDATKQIELTAGYAYERYRYSDIGYDNTTYVAGTGTSAAYTTGQFAFQPYTANIVYGLAKYKF